MINLHVVEYVQLLTFYFINWKCLGVNVLLKTCSSIRLMDWLHGVKDWTISSQVLEQADTVVSMNFTQTTL